jgi:hypothetical protein
MKRDKKEKVNSPIKNMCRSQASVAHTCNPSYSEIRRIAV